ncbi:hypothetical protein DOY81_011860 [Sarcophaga bullata]|nr:hypothetical protein DOY81_011860 [Sarcophaga bullata]
MLTSLPKAASLFSLRPQFQWRILSPCRAIDSQRFGSLLQLTVYMGKAFSLRNLAKSSREIFVQIQEFLFFLFQNRSPSKDFPRC